MVAMNFNFKDDNFKVNKPATILFIIFAKECF